MKISDLKYDQLLGDEFIHGSQDCYGLGRRFFFDNFGLEFEDYARPDKWWDTGLNLYMDYFMDLGFEVVDNPRPLDLKPCDVFLCAIKSKVANHCAIYLGGDYIVHHFYGRRSNREMYKGIWRNTTVAVLRHSSLKDMKFTSDVFNLMDDPRIAMRLRHEQAS